MANVSNISNFYIVGKILTLVIYAFGVVSKGFSFVKTFIAKKYRGVQMAQPNLIISRLKKSGIYQSDTNRSIIKNSGSNVKNHNSRCERASYGNGNIKGLSRYFKAKQLAHRTNC